MFQGTQAIVRLVVSLAAAAVLAALLCHVKERLDRQPGPEPLPLTQAEGTD